MIRPGISVRLLCLLAVLVSAAPGCVERVRDLTASERAQVRDYVSHRAPSPQHRLSVRFGDDLQLIGYDVSANRWEQGQKVRFTWYWHATADMPEGYRAFTHICDPTGAKREGADDEGVVRKLYPVGRFREGEYVRDVQELTLPMNFDAAQAAIYLGAYRGNDRMPVTLGPDDGDSRVRVVTLPTGASATAAAPARLDVPRLRVARATGAIRLDGRLDEPAWRTVGPTSAFVDTMSGAPVPQEAFVHALWDDESLYVAFVIEDDFLSSPFRNPDDHLWEKDCAEIMLDPDGDGRNYFELQASPRGTVFDTRYDTRRIPGPFGHVDWNSGMRVGVNTGAGRVDDDVDDERYVVEVAIPWAGLRAGLPAPTTPPAVGTVWRANFYVMDTTRNGVRASAWSPPRIPDFHFPPRFGELVFEGPR